MISWRKYLCETHICDPLIWLWPMDAKDVCRRQLWSIEPLPDLSPALDHGKLFWHRRITMTMTKTKTMTIFSLDSGSFFASVGKLVTFGSRQITGPSPYGRGSSAIVETSEAVKTQTRRLNVSDTVYEEGLVFTWTGHIRPNVPRQRVIIFLATHPSVHRNMTH